MKKLSQKIVKLLSKKKLKISFAESCTGGLLSSAITSVSGSSKIFALGLVTYSNQSKNSVLKIPKKILRTYGAVSYETCLFMVKNLSKISKTEISVSITGIAGPTGGSEEKPVGLTFIAVSDAFGTWSGKYTYTHDRIKNKERVAQTALNLVRMRLLGLLEE